ncbi:MAG: tetratricopeptide repeat protein [Pseudomonadota bacterium]|nr:tetratricopeptide repeat protein [Pseudomonadota bacterium]
MVDIFQEIDEELRQDRLQKLWRSYGRFIIAGVVLVIGAAAGWKGWDHYSFVKRMDSSHQYQVAENLLREGKPDDALALFSDLSRKGFGSYQKLGEIRKAALLRASGNIEAAVDIYTRISQDTSQSRMLRDAASLNLVLTKFPGSDKKLQSLVSYLRPLADAGRPFRFTALEVLGLLELKRGDRKAAESIFKELADALEAPEPMRTRAAQIMTTLKSQ